MATTNHAAPADAPTGDVERGGAAGYAAAIQTLARALRQVEPRAHEIRRELRGRSAAAAPDAQPSDTALILAGYLGLCQRHGAAAAARKMAFISQALATLSPEEVCTHEPGRG